jgi:hypothetical protein
MRSRRAWILATDTHGQTQTSKNDTRHTSHGARFQSSKTSELKTEFKKPGGCDRMCRRGTVSYRRK